MLNVKPDEIVPWYRLWHFRARAVVIDRRGNIHAEVDCSFGTVKANSLTTTWEAALFGLIGKIPAALRSEIGAIALDGTSSTVILCDSEETTPSAATLQ